MSSNLVDDDLDSIFEQAIAETDELFAVTPTVECIETLIEVSVAYDGQLPEIRLLAERRPLKTAMDDFTLASHAAELADQGRLSIRGRDQSIANNLLVTERRVVTIVDTHEYYAGLVGERDELVEAAYETYERRWEQASEHSLRAPPMSTVKETLGDELGEGVKHDFEHLLNQIDRVSDNGGLDEVTISLLAAARNEELLYDVSKWGENIGIASKATFSRTKSQLEDAGILKTEKVPIDVGRPRLRLKLGEELGDEYKRLLHQTEARV